MARIFKTLNDPQLVVKFQRCCGVYPATSGSAPPQFVQKQPNTSVSNLIRFLNDFSESSSTVERKRTSCNWSTTHPTVTQSADAVLAACNGIHPEHRNGFARPNLRERAASNAVGASSRNISHMKKDSTASTDFSATESDSDQSCADSSNKRSSDFVATNLFLDYLFHFGASLGNEVFYITFFPFWFWNIDGYVGRRLCVFWCIFMYLGQATKDIIRWPRPPAPPVMRMEKRYALEYGMPSTHAMVGAGLPFTILILTKDRYVYTFEWGLLVAVLWCSTVCLSRLYLGMHSVLDILAGLIYIFALMPVCFPLLNPIDEFLLNSPYAPAVSVLVPLVLALAYPTLDKWSTARGDTTLILGVGAGVALGHWVCYQYGFMHKALTPPPYEILMPNINWLGQVVMRLCLGVVILVATRALMKATVYNVACYLSGVNRNNYKRTTQMLSVELPYKFVTYLVIAFNTVWLAPQVFHFIGIERETFFTEI